MSYKALMALSAALIMPFSSLASEDSTPILFGGEVNYETAIANPADHSSADEAKITTEVKDIQTPPPSDYMPIQLTPPAPLPPTAETDEPEQLQPTSQPVLMLQNPTQVSDDAEDEDLPQIGKNQELTATLKQDTPAQGGPSLPIPNVEGTWVDKLASTNPLAVIGENKEQLQEPDSASLETLVNKARTPLNDNRRSNASVFDVSGVMLRMSLAQVEETMKNRGFRKMMEKYQIPNFIKWRNEEYCRNSGVVGYERTEACVTQKAKKDKHEYVQVTKYAKFDTKEEMEVAFTSNFTDNKVYKIIYKSMAANSTGNSPKAVYLRNIKVYDFWKKINQKYGKPDNKNNVTWGMGGNKPFLKAKTGYLLLEDPMLRELDYTRMSREDQRYMNTDLYSF